MPPASDEYTTPPPSDDEEGSFSEASWDDVDDDQDFLNDVEASDLEEGEESEPQRSKVKPKPKLDPQPPKAILRKHMNGVNGTNGARTGSAAKSRAPNDIVGKRLKPPAVVQVSCKMLFDQIESREIDLDAEYQRDVVWPEKNQSKLIDSIFRNYYIPPVVFSRQEKGMQEVKICVDGKQRLTSIWKFMLGEIPFLDKKTMYKYFWKTPPTKGKSSRILPEEWKREFMRAQITTVGFAGLEAAEERDIFQRVQMGMSLSTPEKWQALQGPWPDFLRELRGSFFNHDVPARNILAHIPWDATRAKDFQDLVRMAFLVNSIIVVRDGSPPPVSTDKLEAALSSEEGPSARFIQHMTVILVTFQTMVTEPKWEFAFSGKVAPVELVMIAVLIGKCHDMVTERELAQGIREMRDDIRAITAKGYIMWKPEVVRKMLNFIDKWKSRRRMPEDRTTIASYKSKAIITARESSARKKRKAVETDEDSSGDEPLQARNVRPKPSTSTVTIPKKSPEAPTPMIPKKSTEAPKAVKPEPRISSLKIGTTNVATPQRVELPPIVSRESWKSPGGRSSTSGSDRTLSSIPSFKKEERSPVEPKRSASINTAPRVAPTVSDPMAGMSLDQKLDQLTKEIAELAQLMQQVDRPDHAELSALYQQKGSLKSQLSKERFLLRSSRSGSASRLFGGP